MESHINLNLCIQQGDISRGKEKFNREGVWHRGREGKQGGQSLETGKDVELLYLFIHFLPFRDIGLHKMAWCWEELECNLKHCWGSRYPEAFTIFRLQWVLSLHRIGVQDFFIWSMKQLIVSIKIFWSISVKVLNNRFLVYCLIFFHLLYK